MALTYDQLRVATDLEAQVPCTPEENRRYNELLNNGQPLPNGIVQTYKGENNSSYFAHTQNKMPIEQEQLYILMRISKDVHFIRNVVQAGLILGIIAAAILLIALMF